MTTTSIPATDDMLLDMDRYDKATRGRMTEVKRYTVLRLHGRMGRTVTEIASMLALEETSVRDALASFDMSAEQGVK